MSAASSKKSPKRQRRADAPTSTGIKKSATPAKVSAIGCTKKRINELLARRPHRSFRLTRRRDYIRPLSLPGYWAFTGTVLRVMRDNRRNLLWLVGIYCVASVLFLGIGTQEDFSALRETMSETSEAALGGQLSEIGQAVVLTFSTIAGNITPQLSTEQQVYAVIVALLVWLTVVWLLRQAAAGAKVSLRDALYSSGAPIVPTAILALVMAIQLLPVGVAVLGYSAAATSGLLEGGVEAMLFWIAAILLTTLSAYWVTSTFFAMVIVTLPGMYPIRALRIAGDMMVGRRLRLLYRLLWMLLFMAAMWVVVLLPSVLIDSGLKQWLPSLDWLPIVPVVFMLLSATSLIYTATYVYMLYRRVVDNDSASA